MANKHTILGISCFYHDSAACLLQKGQLVAAVQEERFTRKKHDFAFPENAITFCLNFAGISIDDVDYVAFYDKPFIKFERILETCLQFVPLGITSYLRAMPLWIQQKLWIRDLIEKKLRFKGHILFAEHHESHAASAFFPSPFEEAAFLTLDGVGEWTTSSYGIGRGNQVQIISELKFPHSLGLLYSAFTYFTGFKVNNGEYKVMGLAPYGEPRYVQKIYDYLIDLKDDGSFRMNMSYFNFCTGLTMTSKKFEQLFDGPPRKIDSPVTQREMDLARSVQDVTEEIMFRMARHVRKETGQKKLCLAGGVALNCVGNGKLLRSRLFDDIWIQPAAGDAGGALGAAYIIHYHYLKNPEKVKNRHDSQKGTYLGPEFSESEIEQFLKQNKLLFRKLTDTELFTTVADHLIREEVIGWFQGRMEFGPRALGNRSILGDARSPRIQKRMNLKIKYRENFRPFAPSVLKEYAQDWFELEIESPYMLFVAEIKNNRRCVISETEKNLQGIDKLNTIRSEIPAVTHVDYSARIHTVDAEINPRYHALIRAFFEKTGCPVIVNTSFNVRGEPIVLSPLDAYRCFMHTDMDVLVIGNCLIKKTEQND